MCFADIVIFSIKEIPNNITKLANIARICRFCYALSGFYNYSICQLYHNLIYHRIVNFSGSLVGSIFLCKVTAARERQVPFH